MEPITFEDLDKKFDRYNFLKKRVKEHFEYAQSNGYEVVCCLLQGSQNYELDVYTDEYKSDVKHDAFKNLED